MSVSRVNSPLTSSSPPPAMHAQTASRVTPPNSEERPMKRKRTEPERLDPSYGDKKREAPSKASSKKKAQQRKKAKTAGGQNVMKTTPALVSSHNYAYPGYQQEIQAFPPVVANRHGYTAATSEYPVVMGGRVMRGGGGVRFKFGGLLGRTLEYEGTCGNDMTGKYRESKDELSVSPLGCDAAVVMSTREPERTTGGPLHPPSSGPQGGMNEPPPLMTPGSCLFDLSLVLSPPPSDAQQAASLAASAWYYAQSTTPQRAPCPAAPPKTPTSMPAVTTPKKLTESAKKFDDALHPHSSPLDILASAAGLEAYSTMPADPPVGGSTAPPTQPGATPALEVEGGTPISPAKKPLPSFPASMPPMGNGSELKDGSPGSRSAAGVAKSKRYNIRPKEGCRVAVSAAAAAVGNASSAIDLLFERPRQDPSVFAAGSVMHAPPSSLPLLGGQCTSGATA